MRAAQSILKGSRPEGITIWGVALRHPVLRIVLRVDSVHRIENVSVKALAATEDKVLRIQDEIAIVLDTAAILERLETAMASAATFHDLA